jgi:Ulp1 family protease
MCCDQSNRKNNISKVPKKARRKKKTTTSRTTPTTTINIKKELRNKGSGNQPGKENGRSNKTKHSRIGYIKKNNQNPQL